MDSSHAMVVHPKDPKGTSLRARLSLWRDAPQGSAESCQVRKSIVGTCHEFVLLMPC